MDIATPEKTANEAKTTQIGGIDSGRLRSLIERIERLEEEKKEFRLIFAIFSPKRRQSVLM